MGLKATFVHIQGKIGQEELGINQMTHPEIGFKNRAPVRDPARYLAVMEAAHTSENETSNISVAMSGG